MVFHTTELLGLSMKNLTSCVLSLYTVLVAWLFEFELELESC